ncbi:MAG: hypothetical protein AAGB02_08235 [Pseudomonadota bacterium]
MKTRSLFVLALVFLLAALGRAGVIASDANVGASGSDSGTPPVPERTCVEPRLAAAVSDRISILEEEETAIEERRATLSVYEMQIEKRLAELKQANDALAESAQHQQSKRDGDIIRLAAIYEGMKPAQASPIIEKMDPKFAAGLLGAMNSEQAAQIVATMNSDKAYLISVMLANRSATGR